MKPLSSSGGRIAAFLAAGALAAGVWTQAGASPAPAVRAADKPAIQKTGPAKVERLPGDDGARAAIPPAIEIEIQRRFNEIEKERLDDRADTIDWWLAAVAIVLTFFGIVVAIAGLFGFRKFQQIEKEALGSAAEGKRHVEEARKLVEEIKGHRDESQTIIRNMTAENFAEMDKDDPEKARRAAEEVRENPRASLMDRAVAAALFLQKEGRKDEAVEKWRGIAKVAEGDDDDLAARAWFSIGYLFQEKGKPGEAIAAYDESIRLKPDLAEAYNNRGVAKKDLGQREAAIADYDEAIRLKPNDAEAYNNRGNAKNNLGQREAAIADYDEALRLKPDYAEAFNNRGNAKKDLGQREAAIADHDEAIRLKPNNAEAYNNRGNAKGDLGQHEAAIADYDEAIRLKPDYATAYYNRGVASVGLDNKDAARRDFGKAHDLARKAGEEDVATQAERALKELDDLQGA